MGEYKHGQLESIYTDKQTDSLNKVYCRFEENKVTLNETHVKRVLCYM